MKYMFGIEQIQDARTDKFEMETNFKYQIYAEFTKFKQNHQFVV